MADNEPTVGQVADNTGDDERAAFDAGAKAFIRIDWDGPSDEVRIERAWQRFTEKRAARSSGVADTPKLDPQPWVNVNGWRSQVQAWHPTNRLSTFSPAPEFEQDRSKYGVSRHGEGRKQRMSEPRICFDPGCMVDRDHAHGGQCDSGCTYCEDAGANDE